MPAEEKRPRFGLRMLAEVTRPPVLAARLADISVRFPSSFLFAGDYLFLTGSAILPDYSAPGAAAREGSFSPSSTQPATRWSVTR